MEKDEALKRTDHYRCTRCGRLSPLTESLCTNPICRAQLSIYGELVAGEEAGDESKIKVPDDTNPGTGGGTVPPPKKEKKKKEKAAPPDGGTKPDKPKKRWTVSKIITGLVMAAMAVALCVSFGEAARWRDDYHDLRSNYWDLEDDYDDLEDDYNDLKNTYDDWLRFMENNGISDLYSIEVTDVFNADSEGDKIDYKLDTDTMDRLAIGIDIYASDCKNRWADPLEIKLLTPSGSEFCDWSITPGEKYNDDTGVVGWRMWVANLKVSGTYVAEFYHKGYIVERHEIVVG